MVSGIVVVPVVLVVSASSLSIIHYSIIRALRVRFRIILICGEIIGLHRFFCAHAGVCIISMGELMILRLLVPGVRQRLTLRVSPMSIDLNSSILISVFLMRALIIVNFIVLQRDIDSNSECFFSFRSSEDRTLSVKTN